MIKITAYVSQGVKIPLPCKAVSISVLPFLWFYCRYIQQGTWTLKNLFHSLHSDLRTQVKWLCQYYRLHFVITGILQFNFSAIESLVWFLQRTAQATGDIVEFTSLLNEHISDVKDKSAVISPLWHIYAAQLCFFRSTFDNRYVAFHHKGVKILNENITKLL